MRERVGDADQTDDADVTAERLERDTVSNDTRETAQDQRKDAADNRHYIAPRTVSPRRGDLEGADES